MRTPQKLSGFITALSAIYSTRNENAKGRLVTLGSSLITAIYNVFITGIFYTGFLSMYDISITDFGIISFIPYIASCFSVFSGVVLSKFKNQKKVLLWSKIYFYAMYIIATTVMPEIVQEHNARMYWFIAIQFLAYSVYALFSPGFTTWFYTYYPESSEQRTKFFMYNQIFSSILSCVILLTSGFITDAVAGSPHQKSLILGMRYFAFLLVLVDVFMQSRASNPPSQSSASVKLKDVFTLPFKYKKFACCLILMFVWNYNSTLNSGLWNYHLLNHMQFSYTLLNSMSVVGTVILIASSPFWRRLINRNSWIKTFGIANLYWVITEVTFFCMTRKSTWIYIPCTIVQQFLNVGFNLAYANVLYMNLPTENNATHIAFYCIGCNFCAFLGLITGTLISGISGDTTIPFLGMDIYTVQFTTLARAFLMAIIGIVCTLKWKLFTNDEEIADVQRRREASDVHANALKKALSERFMALKRKKA